MNTTTTINLHGDLECRPKTPAEIAAEKAAEAARPIDPLVIAKYLLDEAQDYRHTASDKVAILQEAREWMRLVAGEDRWLRQTLNTRETSLGVTDEQVGIALKRCIDKANRSQGNSV